MWNSLKSPLILLLFMVSNLWAKDYSRLSLKLRCFQCWSPNHCQHGACYGDVCVKTSANGHATNGYVVKGCENSTFFANLALAATIVFITASPEHSRSVTTDIYEPHMKHKSYCKTEIVLGIDTTICYCRDGDWCNASASLITHVILFFIGYILL